MFILALKIHCSKECKDILDILDGYHLSERGYVNMKVTTISSCLYRHSSSEENTCVKPHWYVMNDEWEENIATKKRT